MNAVHHAKRRTRPVEFVEPPSLPPWLGKQLPWRRRVARIGEHKVHFIDHQDHRDHAVLLMHGNPTWSYLWRKVIHALSGHPVRIIAPDLVGLGLSSKPRDVGFHTLADHIQIQTALVRALNVKTLTIVGQDWGGPIVSGVGYNLSDRLHGIVYGNTGVLPPKHFKATAFHQFSHTPVVSDLVFRSTLFPVPVMWTTQGDKTSIGPRELRAYAYPFGKLADRAAPLALARMVPTYESHPAVEIFQNVGSWVASWRGPASLVWGLRDPILGRALKRLAEALPQAVVRETQAGHFLQEEVPEMLAEEILRVVASA